MPRGKIDGNIKSGIITTSNLAVMIGCSTSHIQKLCRTVLIPSMVLPGSNERRIHATPELLDKLAMLGFSIHDNQLQEAVSNYCRRHQIPKDILGILSTEVTHAAELAHPVPEPPSPNQLASPNPQDNPPPSLQSAACA